RSVEITGTARYTGWLRGEEFLDAGRHPGVEFDSLPSWPETVESGGDLHRRLTRRGISHPAPRKVEKAECARP
ncbi:YceI family protein, partial [Stenotrophomonas maltophilia]|uniref:YceI family protein n=1 Tax=Stenotrophomonas maltophilia TaxID=40324 RepID=UPI00314C453C